MLGNGFFTVLRLLRNDLGRILGVRNRSILSKKPGL